MRITKLSDHPSDSEIQSYQAAFSEAPWSENIPDEDAQKYLAKFRESGSAVLAVHELEGADPFLYVHFTDYRDVERLVADEFDSESAFYVAKNPEVVSNVLTMHERVCFISNIHADRDVAVGDDHKPRLKALPAVLDACFEQTGADCAALFTHVDTNVYRSCQDLNPEQFRVSFTDYEVQPTGNTIESLALITIVKQGV